MLTIFDRIQNTAILASMMFENIFDKDDSRDENRAAGDNFNNDGDNTNEDINAATENSEPETEAREKETKPTETNSSEIEVDAATEAAMSSGNRVDDLYQPGKIRLGPNVVVDNTKLKTPAVDNATFVQMNMNGAISKQNPYTAYMEQQQMTAQQSYMQQPNPMFMNSMPQQQTFVPPQAPIRGHGNHKIDNPEPPKKEVKKADADNVDVDLSALHGVETNPPKPPKQLPDAVSSKLENPGPIEKAPTMPAFDNTAVTSKQNCRYLGEIEKLALSHGLQIRMIERVKNGTPIGLINCYIYTPELGLEKPNDRKCFTIDTGMIIDHRAKIFPAVLIEGYEDVPAFPVLIPDPNNKEGKKAKNILNTKVLEAIFTGGADNLNFRESMYRPNFMELNKNVALITRPTQNMDKETRDLITNRLMSAMEKGVFKEVHKVDGYSRFIFKHYDKKDNSFVLSNMGVPYRFGGDPHNKKNIEIIFASDSKTRIKYVD